MAKSPLGKSINPSGEEKYGFISYLSEENASSETTGWDGKDTKDIPFPRSFLSLNHQTFGVTRGMSIFYRNIHFPPYMELVLLGNRARPGRKSPRSPGLLTGGPISDTILPWTG
ncbi:hypothetical protein phiLo_92 [Thermus phage phiLo]|nr:hypothetical protein phiLo_92 [Thermus phage phiLo]